MDFPVKIQSPQPDKIHVQPMPQRNKAPDLSWQPKKTTWLGRAVQVVAVAVVLGVVAVAATVYAGAIFIGEALVFSWEILRETFSWKTMSQIEAEIHKKGLGKFAQQIRQVDGINQKRALKRLAECPKGSCEMKVLKYLEKHVDLDADHFKEMLKGAHIRLNDGGKAFEVWSKLATRRDRISSHPSSWKQFSIQGKLLKEMLFSSHIDPQGKRYTWFQLERNPTSIGHMLRHAIDYIKYRISSANQGPFGSSLITDKAPLCFKLRTAVNSSYASCSYLPLICMSRQEISIQK